MTEHTVLLLEPNRAALKRAQDLIESLGHTAIGVNGVDTALHLVTTQQPSVVLASHPTQERVIARLRESGLGQTSLVVSLPAKVSQPQDIAEGLGADAFVVRPYRRETLASALHAALAIRHVRAHLVELAADLERERARLQRMGDVDPQTSFYHFEFFKRLLLFEILRAKRYGYELALCLVALDPLPGMDQIAPEARKDLESGVAVAIRGAIRDIDIPVHYSEGRYLVFLPHTDAKGAEMVGRRISQRIRRAIYRDGNITVSPAASIGIAGLRKGKGVSFSRLIKDAQAALRAAQLKGGNQVIARW
ncbi:MAG TPA: GGDEF domain-containing protein [Polyangia bacterium]|nr:GGDEF domain-containing protein [Polyangia bacterium]